MMGGVELLQRLEHRRIHDLLHASGTKSIASPCCRTVDGCADRPATPSHARQTGGPRELQLPTTSPASALRAPSPP
ncbi:hypothetical protein XOC_2014 [Xanthomonas oryzae pv. oryzicola BLS256]|uniref:Uncharacterized protein n=1 Tax=Xanthomonas oryzae pv. oryzicola (strain BLS256) TaxID=383407 RepID=G7TCI4_XANOB|nr:hypothetical protein XOC_2014 [Xanthomonas oryzae pv. oryzicola BLS256]QEO97888.1 hypothetical protein XOCgx_2899 [Xanthomonas oryzae pv. oryzicola]